MTSRVVSQVLVVALLFPVSGRAQVESIDEDIQFHSHELDRLREEIKDFERRIRETSHQEKSTAQKVDELDEEITLVRNLLYRLKKEEHAKKRAIEEAKEAIRAREREYAALQERYARRVVDVYTRGKLSELALLFDSESWRQAIYRSKYLTIISNYDRILAGEIRSALKEIGARRLSLEKDLKDLEKIDRERTARKVWLERNRRLRNRELVQLKKDRQNLTEALQARRSAVQELEKIILRLERERAARLAEMERRRREEEVAAASDFVSLKGRLPWPVEGPIVSRFGSQRNPTLKTVTENPGIDIRGEEGSEVRAVFNGTVTTVTYIRGYGNTIIIDHGGGFYTVYTHVTDVEVGENTHVRAQEVIAHVGDSGSLDGAKLHFEVWGNRQKLNPEAWLVKKG
ncbi:MAG: murein hydrolase activator EnvC family protein [Fidelibacterota bacterium]